MTWIPDFLKNLSTANYGMWNAPDPGLTTSGRVQPGEGGVDIGTPIGTPVYAIADGQIIGAGYYPDNAHGVITTRINVPGVGIEDLYYQHIQLDPSIKQCHGYGGSPCSQAVKRGQRIGTIGPFNEIEMGFNSQWGGIWGGNYKDPSSHPGPWVRDPRPWIKAVLDGNGAAPSNSVSTPNGDCGVDPVCILTQWWATSLGPTFKLWGEYIAIFLLAVSLMLVGFFLLSGQSAMQAIRKVGA
jgi:hypothetical protein